MNDLVENLYKDLKKINLFVVETLLAKNLNHI